MYEYEHQSVSYEEHKTFLAAIELEARAELDGFMDAALFDAPRQAYRADRFQRKYEQGFRDGKAKQIQPVVA